MFREIWYGFVDGFLQIDEDDVVVAKSQIKDATQEFKNAIIGATLTTGNKRTLWYTSLKGRDLKDHLRRQRNTLTIDGK